MKDQIAKLKTDIISLIFFCAILLAFRITAEAYSNKNDKFVATLVGKSTPSAGWSRLENDYFQVDFPNCFKVKGSLGEGEDESHAPVVNFWGSGRCESLNWPNDSFEVSRSVNWRRYKLSLITVFEEKLKTDVMVNGMPAKLFARVIEHGNNESGRKSILSWELYIKCGEEMIMLGFRLPEGKASEAKIDQNDFELPKEFQEVAASLRCGKLTKAEKKK